MVDYITIKEASDRLRLSYQTVWGYIQSGKVSGFTKTISGRIRIPIQEVDRLLGQEITHEQN